MEQKIASLYFLAALGVGFAGAIAVLFCSRRSRFGLLRYSLAFLISYILIVFCVRFSYKIFTLRFDMFEAMTSRTPAQEAKYLYYNHKMNNDSAAGMIPLTAIFFSGVQIGLLLAIDGLRRATRWALTKI